MVIQFAELPLDPQNVESVTDSDAGHRQHPAISEDHEFFGPLEAMRGRALEFVRRQELVAESVSIDSHDFAPRQRGTFL